MRAAGIALSRGKTEKDSHWGNLTSGRPRTGAHESQPEWYQPVPGIQLQSGPEICAVHGC